jgi:hypothetical protein
LSRIPIELHGSDHDDVKRDGSLSDRGRIKGMKTGRAFIADGSMFVELSLASRSLARPYRPTRQVRSTGILRENFLRPSGLTADPRSMRKETPWRPRMEKEIGR